MDPGRQIYLSNNKNFLIKTDFWTTKSKKISFFEKKNSYKFFPQIFLSQIFFWKKFFPEIFFDFVARKSFLTKIFLLLLR